MKDTIAIIKTTWRKCAAKIQFRDDWERYNSGLAEVDSPIGPLTFRYTFGVRDDCKKVWFAVECQGILVHCGPMD